MRRGRLPDARRPDSVRLTVEVDGRVAGMVQYWEETDPKYRHAGIDLFLDSAVHGRGIGSEVVRRVARMLIEERGHHRVTIDPPPPRSGDPSL
jgi:aminoglycoside 6'-N-acetyltransferase